MQVIKAFETYVYVEIVNFCFCLIGKLQKYFALAKFFFLLNREYSYGLSKQLTYVRTDA